MGELENLYKKLARYEKRNSELEKRLEQLNLSREKVYTVPKEQSGVSSTKKHKPAEELLAEHHKKEEQLKMILETGEIGLWDFDPLTGKLNFSEECKRIHGLASDVPFQYESFLNLIPTEKRDEVNEKIKKAIATKDGTSDQLSYKIIRADDGRERWLSSRFRFQDNILTGILKDITADRQNYDNLLKSENIFKSIALNIPNSLIIVVDKAHRFLAVEGDLMHKMGYDSKNYEGKHPTEVAPPERYEATKHLYEKVLAGEKFSTERKSDTGEFFMVHFVPLKNEDVGVYAGLIIALDINDVKQSQQHHARLASIVESSEDAIISKTLAGIITSWNSSAERIFGYTAAEIIGKSILTIIPEDRIDEEEHILEKLRRGERVENFETIRVRKDQKNIDISLTISPVRDEQNNIIGLSKISRDITERKQVLKMMNEREEKLTLALKAADLGTFDIDLVKQTMIWDARCRELFGIFNEDVVNYEFSFLEGMHEDDRERVDAVIQNLYKGENGGDYDEEYRTIGMEDKKLRWVRAIGKVLFDSSNHPVRFIGVVLDITNHKLQELKKGDFVAIVSHELKTPLTSIKSYVQLLLAKAKKEEESFTVNALTKTEVQINKMAFMINDFLSLARMEEGKINLIKEHFELHPFMEEIVNDTEFINSSHQFKLIGCEHILIDADKDKIAQVLINLISNAIKYSPKGALITIGCEQIGEEVKIYVKDEGVGISAKDLKNLFNRFYRVENEKVKNISGFGIGLYLVAEILRYHGSKIEVESQEGVGSTFYFYLACEKVTR